MAGADSLPGMNAHESEGMTARCDDRQQLRQLRLERDRHVAFAFAAADLLIEVSADGSIVAAAGAAQAILGVSLARLVGAKILDFVAASDRPLARRLLKLAHTAFRIDPVVLQLLRDDGSVTSTLFGACQLPDRDDSVFLSVALVPDSLVQGDRERDPTTGLLAPDALSDAAQRLSVDDGRGARQLQLVKLNGLSGATRQLPEDRACMLMQEIGAALRTGSIGGDAAGRLADDTFGVVTRTGNDAVRDAALNADLAEAIRGAGIPEGEVGSQVTRIELSPAGLSDKDAGRAIAYAISGLVKSLGESLDVVSLRNGLAAAMKEAVSRVAGTRRMLTDERFSLVYQPVVDLSTREIHHYEVLTRFGDGADTFETVVFSEDVGLVMELDLIVCKRAIKAIEQSDNASVAVNLSGRSVQNNAFRHALSALIDTIGDQRPRLLFELTESAGVDNTAEAAAFLAGLRRKGHAVCLDDFGAGAAAYNYLRRFDVDFLKIDGPFLKAAGNRGRDRGLIRSICVLCQETGCKVIGEMIEDEAAAPLAAKLGIGYGQGWLFGRPLQGLPKPIRSLRRKGTTETWQ
jgi:EAL domain-containing protein (putative c-di-GMP-specific phosphodiesterase class I)/PAS domain-containing protein